MDFLDLRSENKDRAFLQKLIVLRARKNLGKVLVLGLADLACINKSTFYAHQQAIHALAVAMERETGEVVEEGLPHMTAGRVNVRTEGPTKETFRAFTRNRREISGLFSSSHQRVCINCVDASITTCIS